MRSRVSARERAALPLSLMVRLERMAQGQSWQAAGEDLEDIGHDPGIEPRSTWAFGLGAFAGVVVAGAAFVSVAALELPGPSHNPRQSAANPPAERIAAAPAANKAVQPVVFEVAVERARAAHVPFGLQLTGSDASDIEVMLSNVPPAALLSHGQRRSESTWTVRAAELGQLHLTLHDGTPETFDVRIDVLAPPSMSVAPSIAKVRLVGAAIAAPAPTALAETETPAANPVVATVPEPPAPPTKAEARSIPPSRSTEAAKLAAPQPKRPPPAVAHAGSTGKQGAPTPPPWTEAPSALGATSRGGEWDRQVWWQLPLPFWPPAVEAPPAWSPFLDPPAHR